MVHRFVDEMLRRTLYPHALWLLPFAELFRSRFLAPDREIIGDIGYASDMKGVGDVISRMPWYYGRRWGFRRWSRLRISSKRMRRIAREIFKS